MEVTSGLDHRCCNVWTTRIRPHDFWIKPSFELRGGGRSNPVWFSVLLDFLSWANSQMGSKWPNCKVTTCCCSCPVLCLMRASNHALPIQNMESTMHHWIFSYFYLMLGPTRALCPVRSTTDGNCCVFPFVYQGKQHNYCTGVDSQDLWCQTSSVNKQGQMSGTCSRKWWRFYISGCQERHSCRIRIPPFLYFPIFVLPIHVFVSPFFLSLIPSTLHYTIHPIRSLIPLLLHLAIPPPFPTPSSRHSSIFHFSIHFFALGHS